eukprot:3740363-Pleurochrysis_carterae.AAC.2
MNVTSGSAAPAWWLGRSSSISGEYFAQRKEYEMPFYILAYVKCCSPLLHDLALFSNDAYAYSSISKSYMIVGLEQHLLGNETLLIH